MIDGARSGGRPEELALLWPNFKIIDARFSASHPSFVIKLPEFVSVTPMPLSVLIAPFVLKSNRNPPLSIRPKLFDESVLEFPFPFPGEKPFDLVSAMDKLTPISPFCVQGVGERNSLWISGVPSVFSKSHLEVRARCVERWRYSNWSAHEINHLLSGMMGNAVEYNVTFTCLLATTSYLRRFVTR